jgi:hypothetical protein
MASLTPGWMKSGWWEGGEARLVLQVMVYMARIAEEDGIRKSKFLGLA